MKIKDILFAIKKRFAILIIIPVVAGLVTAYYNYFMLDDIYQSKTTFVVARDAESASGHDVTSAELSLWQSLVGDYTKIITSNDCINRTVEALSDKYNGQIDLSAGNIVVNPMDGTRVIEVAISNSDPYKACDLTNELVKQFTSLVDEKLNMKYVVIIDEAIPNPYPVFPNRKQNITMAIVAGLLAGAALCFLLEFTDMTLKTNEDVEKHLGLPVLSRIPRYY